MNFVPRLIQAVRDKFRSKVPIYIGLQIKHPSERFGTINKLRHSKAWNLNYLIIDEDIILVLPIRQNTQWRAAKTGKLLTNNKQLLP